MNTWKKEYEGFPLGFVLWMWERHRVGLLVFTPLLFGGLALLLLAPIIALIVGLLA